MIRLHPLLTILTALGLLHANPAKANSDAILNRADQAFTEGQYQDTIQLLEALHGAGTASAHSFLLLGNAYVNIEDPGNAMLAYHRALLLDPNSAEARQNRAVLQRLNHVPIRSTPAWSPPFLWPPEAWLRATLQIGAWLLAFLLVWAWLFAPRNSRQRRTALAAAIVLLLPMGYATFSLRVQNQFTAKPDQTALLLEESHQWATPTRSAPVVQSGLPPGTALEVVASRGEWLYVDAPDANGDTLRGWVRKPSTANLWPWHENAPNARQTSDGTTQTHSRHSATSGFRLGSIQLSAANM